MAEADWLTYPSAVIWGEEVFEVPPDAGVLVCPDESDVRTACVEPWVGGFELGDDCASDTRVTHSNVF